MKKRILILGVVFALVISTLFAQDVVLSSGTPEEAGMSSAILKEGIRFFEEAVGRDELRGVVLLVARNGKIVFHEAIGWKNKEKEIRMGKDTMFRMASNTKPVIATAVSILVEGKKLNYNENVRKYIQAFDNYRSGFIKIHHLLTHTSGFRIRPIFYRPLIPKSAEHPDAPNLQLEVALFGVTGADEIPGTTYSYSNAGFNTLGALIEIASKQPLEVFLDERIYKPLSMKDCYHHEVVEKLDGKLKRMSVVYRKEKEAWVPAWTPGDPPQYPFVRASGGMISTARDYAVFCQMFLNGGIYNGNRILKEETVKLMTSPHTASIYTPEEREKQERFYGYGWSVSKNGVFSHGGSDGTVAWVDPEKKLIILIFTQTRGGGELRAPFVEMVNASIRR
ncbi:MAG: beta-lactamase family protein [Candidatus Aminicenantes bacterium]|nr:beta-lactamase family protein [Candidatus Aminicenantes bacterium]